MDFNRSRNAENVGVAKRVAAGTKEAVGILAEVLRL